MVRSLIVLAALTAFAAPASAQSASLYFDGQTPSGPVAVGDTFTVAVKMDLSGLAAGYLAGADFSITWDPAVLALEGRVLGDCWTSPLDVSDWLEATAGWAYFGCLEFTYPTIFPGEGTWTLVTYIFRVVGPGSTALTFGTGTLTEIGYLTSDGYEFPASPVLNGAYPTYDAPVILSASVPSAATIGNLVTVSANVLNPLGASSITVEFWAGSSTLLGTVTNTVAGGATQALNLTWNTAGFAAGSHPVKARLQGTSIDVAAGTILLTLPAVPPVSAPSSGGSSGGGGGCSATGGAGNFLALAATLAILIAVRLARR